jgi:hypothetical protein
LVKRRNIQLKNQDVDFKKAAERLVKKILDQNLRKLTNKQS